MVSDVLQCPYIVFNLCFELLGIVEVENNGVNSHEMTETHARCIDLVYPDVHSESRLGSTPRCPRGSRL